MRIPHALGLPVVPLVKISATMVDGFVLAAGVRGALVGRFEEVMFVQMLPGAKAVNEPRSNEKCAAESARNELRSGVEIIA